MENLPHQYTVTADANPEGTVDVTSPGLATLDAAPPAEFGGPGNLWSPETFLVAAVSNCFILTFRAVSRASKFDWTRLTCSAVGILDRVDNVTQFTDFNLTVVLQVPAGTDETKARRLLDMAERSCLVTNSLTAEIHLDAEVQIGA